MTNRELLINRITKFSEDEILTVLNAVTLMLEAKELTPKSDCLYGGSHVVISYGHKCKSSVSPTKHVGAFLSRLLMQLWPIPTFRHSSGKRWLVTCFPEMPLIAKLLGLYHQVIFDMRHKILLAL